MTTQTLIICDLGLAIQVNRKNRLSKDSLGKSLLWEMVVKGHCALGTASNQVFFTIKKPKKHRNTYKVFLDKT